MLPQSAHSTEDVIHRKTGPVAIAEKPPCKRRRARTLTRAELNKIAASLTATTKVAVRSAVQALGVAPSEVQIEEVLDRHREIRERRQCRQQQDIERRLGHKPKSPTSTASSRQQPVLLPTGTPAERLARVRRETIEATARSLFRYGAAGGSSFRVSFAVSSQDVEYRVDMHVNYTTFAGSYKGWAANEDHHRLKVPADWRVRVQRKGLAMAGGMMTLDAHPLLAPDGFELYAAVWASQSRGFDVRTHRGFIAISEGEAYHAESAERAIAGVRRKCAAARNPPAARESALEIGVEQFISRYSKIGCVVSLNDARESGSCEYGIRSWCDAVDLDYSNEEAPLAEVLNAFRERPQIEVRRAVLQAVRRHRCELRSLKKGGLSTATLPS